MSQKQTHPCSTTPDQGNSYQHSSISSPFSISLYLLKVNRSFWCAINLFYLSLAVYKWNYTGYAIFPLWTLFLRDILLHPILFRVAKFGSFSMPYILALHTIHPLSVHSTVDRLWVVSSLGYLVLWQPFGNVFWCIHMYAYLLGICLGEELLSHGLCSALADIGKQFSKECHQFMTKSVVL